MKYFLFLLLSIPLLGGCAAKADRAPRYSLNYGGSAESTSSDSYRSSRRYRPGKNAPAPASESYADKDSSKKQMESEEVAEKKPGDNQPEKPETKSDSVKISRMIIYYGDLTLQVLDPEKSVTTAIKMAEDDGGYMKSRDNFTIVLRIPANKFFPFITKIEPFGEITYRRIRSEDVTAQFVDLTMRMNNLIKTRDRLLSILSKATKVSDTLEIEREITRVTGELERIKGSLKYLQNLVSFATLTISFNKKYYSYNPSGKKLELGTPIYWIKGFDISTLLGN